MSNQTLMSDQSFEIRCPICKSVVPADAASCPTCVATPSRRFAVAPAPPPTAASGSAPAARAPEGLAALPLKDYHRLVRANHRHVEGGRGRLAPAGFRRSVVALLPGLLLLLTLFAVAAKTLGWV